MVLTILTSSAHAALTHQYTFEAGNANDSIGSAHGTLMNGATVTGGGVVLAGGDADTESPYVDLPGPSIAINTYSDGFTIEQWMQSTTAPDTFVMSAGLGRTSVGDNDEEAGQGYDYLMVQPVRGPAGEGSRIAITNENFAGEVGITDGDADIADALVHHIAASVDPNAATPQIEYFLDGQSVGTAELGDVTIDGLSNDLAYLGRSLYSDPFFAGTIHEFSIYDHPFDLAEAQASFQDCPVGGCVGNGPTLTVDRTTGDVTLSNDQAAVNLVRYSVTSAAGAIDNSNWTDITNNGDSNSGGSIDPDDIWTVLVNSANEISEEDPVGGTGPDDGVQLTTGFSLGSGLWTQSPFEDLEAIITTYDDINEVELESTIPVLFTGGDGPLNVADLDLDGTVDSADYQILADNAFTELTGETAVETQPMGDLNGDLVNDFFDYRLFQQEYDALNGAGSFAAMVASVPEPCSAWLLALGCLLGHGRRRRARG